MSEMTDMPETDAELMDLLKVPDEDRPQLLRELHAWSRSVLPGPGTYAVKAALMAAMLTREK
jgi:hypothetical protein